MGIILLLEKRSWWNGVFGEFGGGGWGEEGETWIEKWVCGVEVAASSEERWGFSFPMWSSGLWWWCININTPRKVTQFLNLLTWFWCENNYVLYEQLWRVFWHYYSAIVSGFVFSVCGGWVILLWLCWLLCCFGVWFFVGMRWENGEVGKVCNLCLFWGSNERGCHYNKWDFETKIMHGFSKFQKLCDIFIIYFNLIRIW